MDKVDEEVVDKAVYETTSEDGNHNLKWLPSSVVSFAAFDAMKEAEQQAIEIKNDAEVFKAIVDNILEMPMDDERPFDRSEMIMAVAAEFAVRTSPNENKEESLTKEQLHYKEVLEDDTKVKDDDFQGGCSRCGFGEIELIKDLDKCPYCWEAIS